MAAGKKSWKTRRKRRGTGPRNRDEGLRSQVQRCASHWPAFSPGQDDLAQPRGRKAANGLAAEGAGETPAIPGDKTVQHPTPNTQHRTSNVAQLRGR